MDMNYRGECGRERMGRMEWSEGGGKWDNCNSIINKYILKKVLFQKKFLFIYLFQRGEGSEKERERNINVWLSLMCPLLGTWPATQACALTGNRTSDPLVCRPVLNPLSRATPVRAAQCLYFSSFPSFYFILFLLRYKAYDIV